MIPSAEAGVTTPLNTTKLPSIKKLDETDNVIEEEPVNEPKLAETCPGDTCSASSNVII
jgi:hypothetical protein